MYVTRRGLLAGAAVGGGLVVAWHLRPRKFVPPLRPAKNEAVYDAWIKIASDGVVTVAVPQLEMGQGISTLLPQIVAIELGADWRQIAVEPAPASGAYANVPLAARWAPLWRPLLPFLENDPGDILVQRWAQDHNFAVTADGTSLAAYEMPCRLAAASARAMLAKEAASRWGIGWEECDAAEGFIVNDDKRLSFASLAIAAAGRTPPDPPPLRVLPPQEAPNDMGDEAPIVFPRLDLPAKVDGSYQFAGDVRLPDMVYASIRHGPIDKAELTHFEAKAAAHTHGLVGVVKGKRWLAAVGKTWWAAERAFERLAPEFRVVGPLESDAIDAALEEGLAKGEAQRIAGRGEGDDLLGKPAVTARYDAAPALHAGIETASVTARLVDGTLELWLASQAPEHARLAVAKALGMSELDVVLYPMPAGGSFDARLEHDHAIEAALIAREVNRPVQLVWPRAEEAVMARVRPPVAAVLSARTGEGGFIDTWRARIAVPPSAQEFGRRLFGNRTSWAAISDVAGDADPLALEGADPPYGFANVAIDHVPVRIKLPTGRLRGNAHGYTAFFTESFIDEVAHKNNREPLSFRIEMLGQDLRLVQCLQHAARLAQWGGGLDQSGQGIACHRIGSPESGGRIAAVATASRGEHGIVVEKLTAAVDIGRIVNLDIARQQIEGGLVFGIGLALGASVEYAGGYPLTGRLAAMNLPTLANCPKIEVEFIKSSAEPADPGELGVAVAAPAIANALFSATGTRFRRLPLGSESDSE